MPSNLLGVSNGISKSILDQITTNTGDVKSGVKFLDKNGDIQTGSLSLSGNANRAHVLSGETFYSNSWSKQTGTMPNRPAISDLATTELGDDGNMLYARFNTGAYLTPAGTSGYPEIRFSKNLVTGYVPGGNKGAWGTTINPGGSVTIPQGWHNGNGVVRANNPASGWRMRYFGGNADNNYHSQVIGAPDGNGTYAWGCSGYVYWGNENTHLAFDFQGQSYPDKMGNYNNFMFYGTNYFDGNTTLGYRIWGGNLNFYYCRVR